VRVVNTAVDVTATTVLLDEGVERDQQFCHPSCAASR
jgi:hypothetical protein